MPVCGFVGRTECLRILLPSPITYDAVFTGDATGATDVATSLIGFLESHDGQRVALAPNGVYLVSSVVFTARDLTVDFRGARLVAAPPGGRAILRLTDASNVVLDGPSIVGTGYKWEATAGDPAENQGCAPERARIDVHGASAPLINRPVTRDTRGDGIYVGYDAGKTAPATGVVVVDPDIQRASRNGIAPVAGGVAVVGGSIARTGLFGIDFEPNDDVGAQSIEGVVTKVDIRNAADLPSASSHASAPYAIAAGGYSSANKRSIWVEDVTGDALRMTFREDVEGRRLWQRLRPTHHRRLQRRCGHHLRGQHPDYPAMTRDQDLLARHHGEVGNRPSGDRDLIVEPPAPCSSELNGLPALRTALPFRPRTCPSRTM